MVRSRNALCAVQQHDGVMTPYALGGSPLLGVPHVVVLECVHIK